MGGSENLIPSGDQELSGLVEPVRARFLARYEAREGAYAKSRETIRAAANAIRAIHRGEHERAHELITVSRTALDQALDVARPHPEVLYGGFIQDAAKEYAEARLTAAAIARESWPDPAELGLDDAPWLHGLAEAVGELRRRCLDLIRAEDLDEAERVLQVMDEVLACLVTIDVPDALTRGLRRATDGARAVTERTRGDLTAALGQRRLREALDAHRTALLRTVPEVVNEAGCS
ncbi:MAG: haloacid dehalogenase [Actinomycetota bacterium]|nr:haloacid dehalogenase [Actinomycetota bacterium]